jgi:hypothetical protein
MMKLLRGKMWVITQTGHNQNSSASNMMSKANQGEDFPASIFELER